MRLTVPALLLFAALVPATAGAEIFYRDTIHNATGGEVDRPKTVESVLLIDRDIETGALCGYINTELPANRNRLRLNIVIERADGTRIKHSRRFRLDGGEFQECPMFPQSFEAGDVVTFTWRLRSLPRQLRPTQFLFTTSAVARLEPEFFEAQAKELMDMAMESSAKRRIDVVAQGAASLRTHFQQSSFYHADEADNFPARMFNSLIVQDTLRDSELCARFMTYEDSPAGAIVARFTVLRDGNVIAKAKGRAPMVQRDPVGDNVPLVGNFRVCPTRVDLEPGDVVLGRLDLQRLEAKGEEVWFSGKVSASNGLSVF